LYKKRAKVLALFIIGLARPQKAGGGDIVVAIDMAGSMKAEDLKLNGSEPFLGGENLAGFPSLDA
jgi:hypothetical protein